MLHWAVLKNREDLLTALLRADWLPWGEGLDIDVLGTFNLVRHVYLVLCLAIHANSSIMKLHAQHRECTAP